MNRLNPFYREKQERLRAESLSYDLETNGLEIWQSRYDPTLDRGGSSQSLRELTPAAAICLRRPNRPSLLAFRFHAFGEGLAVAWTRQADVPGEQSLHGVAGRPIN